MLFLFVDALTKDHGGKKVSSLYTSTITNQQKTRLEQSTLNTDAMTNGFGADGAKALMPVMPVVPTVVQL